VPDCSAAAGSGVNSFPLITPTRPSPLSGITPMSTLPEALDHSTSTDSAPTLPNPQYPRIRATFPVAAEYSMNSVSAPRCRLTAGTLLLKRAVSLIAVIAPQTTADPSGVMIESSWRGDGELPDPAAQRRPAPVDHAGAHVGQRVGRVREPFPAPVQSAERLLHHVLGRGPVAEHDDG